MTAIYWAKWGVKVDDFHKKKFILIDLIWNFNDFKIIPSQWSQPVNTNLIFHLWYVVNDVKAMIKLLVFKSCSKFVICKLVPEMNVAERWSIIWPQSITMATNQTEITLQRCQQSDIQNKTRNHLPSANYSEFTSTGNW